MIDLIYLFCFLLKILNKVTVFSLNYIYLLPQYLWKKNTIMIMEELFDNLF